VAPRRDDAASAVFSVDPTPPALLRVDIPRIVNGIADMPVRGGLSIVGWGMGSGGVDRVDIALDGVHVIAARHGLKRPDVAAAHPDWAGAMLSGYSAHLPAKTLPVGHHQVTVSMRTQDGYEARSEFLIDVHAVSADTGPCALRRTMSRAEVDQKLGTLSRLDWHPTFHLYLSLGSGRQALDAARRSLDSLTRQTYENWRLWLCPGVANKAGAGVRQRRALLAELTRGFEEVAPRIHWLTGPEAPQARTSRRGAAAAPTALIARLAPGDTLGCDALLELALATGMNGDAEFLFFDDRRISPVDGKSDAYFKPGWSPDLLLATNYIGRAWCAQARLVERAGITVANLHDYSDYDLTLRLTEVARRVLPVPKLLLEQGGGALVSDALERRALRAALERRNIRADIHKGCLPGHYRLERRLTSGRVSIIIPTCAADGYIKTCLQSLRSLTAYRDYEIVCIENIPRTERAWKTWLRTHADVVITTTEPFNWSRYNNLAAARASGSYLLFLNDDTEILDPDWLDILLQQAQRPEVGVVGPLLLYPDRSVQQAGVMLDAQGRGRHAFRHLPDQHPGYFGLALTQRNVISATGACLMMRRETFENLGRFDESHAVINNDLDFCLRAWHSGLLNVYTPQARLIHHEMGSRAEVHEDYDIDKFHARWRRVIARGDPYFNPNLAREHEQFDYEAEPVESVYAGSVRIERDAVRRILVMKLDHIGDCITALPALHRLKRHFPAARITVLAQRATRSIWTADGGVDDFIEFSYFHARSGLGKVEVSERERKTLEHTLRSRRFDLAIDLRKQPDSREVLKLSGAPILVGFDHQGRFPWLDVALEWDEDVPLRAKHGHISDDLNALVEALALRCEALSDAVMSVPKQALALPKTAQRRLFSLPLICIHPASGSPMRQWPLSKFSSLIELLLDLQAYHIAVIGGSDEAQLLEPLIAAFKSRPQVFNLVGRLRLDDLPTLLARAVLFVGNNSGPQHLAAGLGIPTIGIHSGVVDATEWAPLGPRAVALRRAMSCSPCFLEDPKDCHRGVACLTELGVGEVYAACLPALARSSRKSSPPFDGVAPL